MRRARSRSPRGTRLTSLKTKDLDRSLIHGIAWTGLSRWSAQIVSWAVLLYAARVLTPADFGLVAMAMVPIGLARMIEDLGLDAAIVQNRWLDDRRIAELGGLAVLFGGLLCTIYVVGAPFIADIYGEPDVVTVIRALSLLFLLDALQIVPRALLQRDLAFGLLALVNGTQLTLSALVLGAGAWLGLQFWALVLNHLLSHLAVLLLLLAIRPHALHWPRQWRRLGKSVRFGGHMLLTRIAWYGYSNADQLIVGRYAGKDILGAYTFSLTFAQIPVAEVGSLSGKVVPGVFSAVQTRPRLLTRYLLLLTEATSYITIPATIGIALVADDFIPIAIGPQWTEAIIPLQILALYLCSQSVTTLWSHVLIWTGHPHINMWMAVLALVVLPPAFLVGVDAGAVGVAAAWTVVFPLTLVPVFYFIKRILALRFGRFLRCLGPALISTAIMCAAVLAMREVIAADWPRAVRLVANIATGVAAYGLILLTFFHRRVRIIIAIVARAFRRR